MKLKKVLRSRKKSREKGEHIYIFIHICAYINTYMHILHIYIYNLESISELLGRRKNVGGSWEGEFEK